jgi:hypothetical protein
VVPTLTFDRLFAFLVLGHGRRQLLWFEVVVTLLHYIGNDIAEPEYEQACCEEQSEPVKATAYSLRRGAAPRLGDLRRKSRYGRGAVGVDNFGIGKDSGQPLTFDTDRLTRSPAYAQRPCDVG